MSSPSLRPAPAVLPPQGGMVGPPQILPAVRDGRQRRQRPERSGRRRRPRVPPAAAGRAPRRRGADGEGYGEGGAEASIHGGGGGAAALPRRRPGTAAAAAAAEVVGGALVRRRLGHQRGKQRGARALPPGAGGALVGVSLGHVAVERRVRRRRRQTRQPGDLVAADSQVQGDQGADAAAAGGAGAGEGDLHERGPEPKQPQRRGERCGE